MGWEVEMIMIVATIAARVMKKDGKGTVSTFGYRPSVFFLGLTVLCPVEVSEIHPLQTPSNLLNWV
jgi:hypothetical protein